MTFASSRASTCTTAPITVDKSNYWIPSLYYYNPNTTGFQAIPSYYMNAVRDSIVELETILGLTLTS
jgi:hypothetical protein